MINNNFTNQDGFTLVELVMAMGVFTFMFTIITVGFLGVVRTHESGVVQRSVQQNARLALDQVTRSVQQGATTITTPAAFTPISPSLPSPQPNRLCVSATGHRVLFEVINVVVNPTLSVNSLTMGDISDLDDCGTIAPAARTRLTDNTITVTQFAVSQFSATGKSLGMVNIALSVASAYGINELNATRLSCNPGSGSQFCAVTTMKSTAALRGSNNEQ